MSNSADLTDSLHSILTKYRSSLSDKVYTAENNEHDLLMDVFSLTPELKRENRQYWGRELGMCWQLLVVEICKNLCDDYGPALQFDNDEPCDLVVGKYAIDTKYRIGSGDSGTLKKFKAYGPLLRKHGYEPMFLILRRDNLPAAIKACEKGTWKVLTGDATFEFLQNLTGFDVKAYLDTNKDAYTVFRDWLTAFA